MKRVDFENGTITSNILGASLPMLVAQILSLLYNIVDRIYIARIPHIGTAALGAVGLCFPVIVIITAFSNLFGSGGAPLFSIERGKNEPQEAKKIMNISFSMVCICAIVLMVIGFLFARPILVLFGASKDALIYAYPYLMLYLIGTLPSMIATGMNPFINAQGYSTIGMLSVTIGAVTNLLLDPLFIFVFGLGVRGAAIATVISQTLSAAFVFFFLTKKAELKVRLLKKEELASCTAYAKKHAIFFSLLRKVFIVVPLTYLMPYALHMGTNGVFLAEPVSNVIGGGLCFITMLLTVLPELKRMERKNALYETGTIL